MLPVLQELDLSSNPRLEGTLPEYWGRLTNLRRLDLSGCGLSGRLPVTWVALQNAVSINLANNMLGGGSRRWHWCVICTTELRQMAGGWSSLPWHLEALANNPLDGGLVRFGGGLPKLNHLGHSNMRHGSCSW